MTVTTRSPEEKKDYNVVYNPNGVSAGWWGVCEYCTAGYRRETKEEAIAAVFGHVVSSHPERLKVSAPEPLPEPAPYLPPPPPRPPVVPPAPPYGEILRIALPDEICWGVPIPFVTVVRNTGDLPGDFLIRVENTETGGVITDSFHLGGKETTSIRMSTVIPKQGTELRFATFHDETRDDSEILHAEPTVFGFAHIDSLIVPVTMRPGREYEMEVTVRNNGECRDNFLTTITDAVTGEEIFSETRVLSVGETETFKTRTTMPGRRFFELDCRTYRAGVEEWIPNDSRRDKIEADECIILDTSLRFCEFRGPMAGYAGLVLGRDVEFVGQEEREVAVPIIPERAYTFTGRAERGDIDRIEFSDLTELRSRTEIGIAAVIDESIEDVDTEEFTYSTLPLPYSMRLTHTLSADLRRTLEKVFATRLPPLPTIKLPSILELLPKPEE